MALLQKGYLGSTPLFRDVKWYEDSGGTIINDSGAVTVTANTAAHTMGTWTELVASTSADSSFILVVATGIASTSINTATLLTLGAGASGSETAFASNIAIGGSGRSAVNTIPAVIFGFPIKIASGTRIAAQIQSVVTGGKTATIQLFAIDAGDYAISPTSVDVIGTSTANSQGTSFSGSSGTWVQATASTSQSYRAVAFIPSTHNANTNAAAGTFTYTVGVGASGSEVAFGSGRANTSTAEDMVTALPITYLFGRSIPAGSRLAVRHTLPGSPTTIGFTLIGIP